MDRTKNQILRQLISGSKTLWQLIRHQDSSIKEFVEELKKLEREKIIKREGTFFKLIKESLTEIPHVHFDWVCDACGQGIDLNKDFINIKVRFRELVEKRPPPREDYDQGFMRWEDTLKRAVFIYERGDLEDKRVFILGDDDLLTLALALMNLAEHITVVEIDKRIVDFIKETAKKLGCKEIEVLQYNVVNELPSSLKGNYDTFVTDPVETWKGIKFFLGRCIQSLKGRGCSGYFGLTHLEASSGKWYEIEKFLLNCNLVITDIWRDFSFYPEEENKWQRFYQSYRLLREIPRVELPEVDWYRSSLVRIEAVDKIRKPQFPTLVSQRELYFDEESWATPEIENR